MPPKGEGTGGTLHSRPPNTAARPPRNTLPKLGVPPAPTHDAGQNTLWSERRNYFLDALQQGNWRAAYDAMNGHGFTSGDRMVDAEFFAGWVALTKLNDPSTAARHFEALRNSSSTPITQGRALYWLGRAAEARGGRSSRSSGSSRACTEAPEKVRKARTTATSTNQTREIGMRTFQPSFMKWS